MKECSICHKQEVHIIISSIDKDGKVQELALCKECAIKKGISEIKKIKLTPMQILAELKKIINSGDQTIVCNFCKISFAEFRATGRLGCQHCYESFKNQLEPIIKEIHGETTHKGKVPSSDKKVIYERFIIKKLSKQMRQAIQNEEYEKAAAIRDQIRKIKQGLE
ncbi:MAG: UvrB/UvrC motif-containing protein [candidate division WOR-3 bacterium]|nr:UvrB/UvrC motif-containing protein [candidate division WOR-3 bacterium]MCX7757840.1 UvrB/UvrC motif-containing protein [candidate division WOR-3 bacterium]MDW7988409.1 UvrB/UvrC motif-containing protein [candidate division WOR-3 bacterium]